MNSHISGRSESYLEKCIAALPAEKREAARAAFADISDTGEDCYLSKLLAVLEANNAYARTIPRELAAVHEKFLSDLARDISFIRQGLREAETARDTALRKLLHQEVRELDKTLPLTGAIAELRTNSQHLERLRESVTDRTVERIFHYFTLGVGLVVMGVIWAIPRSTPAIEEPEDVRHAREFLATTTAAGIRLGFKSDAKGDVVTVKGPNVNPEVGWVRDASGSIIGFQMKTSARSR